MQDRIGAKEILPEELPPLSGWSSWESVMRQALELAAEAEQQGEVPVGAMLLDTQGNILGQSGNRCVTTNDPTAHAEILALRQAAQKCQNYRLPETILVCTLEPCLMCLGALIWARVAGLIFAATDTKAGAVVSKMDGANLPWPNHHFWFSQGLLADASANMLKTFFKRRRKER